MEVIDILKWAGIIFIILIWPYFIMKKKGERDKQKDQKPKPVGMNITPQEDIWGYHSPSRRLGKIIWVSAVLSVILLLTVLFLIGISKNFLMIWVSCKPYKIKIIIRQIIKNIRSHFTTAYNSYGFNFIHRYNFKILIYKFTRSFLIKKATHK